MEEITSTPKMKTATIIFVALTVFSGLFLESSSAPSSLEDTAGGLLKKVLDPVQSLLVNFHKLLAGVNDPEGNEALKGLREKLKTAGIKLLDAINKSNVGDIVKNLKLVDAVLVEIIKELKEKYGDDAAIKHIFDELDGIVTKLVKQVIAFLKELFDKISNVLVPELNELIAVLIKALHEKAGASGDKELFTEIIEVLNKLSEEIVEIITAVPEAITTGTPDKVETLVAGLKPIIAKLKQFSVQAVLPGVVNNLLTKVIDLVDVVILPELEGIIEIIKNQLVTVLGKTLKVIKALLDGILGVLPAETTELGETLNTIRGILTKLFTELGNGNIVAVQKLLVSLSDLIKKVKAIIANLSEKLGDEAKEILKKVRLVLDEIVNKLLKTLKPILKELFNGLKEIVSKVIKDVGGILKKLKEVLAGAQGELKVLLNKIITLLKELLEKLLDLIKAVAALLGNVTDKSLNKVVEILKALTDISHELTDIVTSGSGNAIGEELVGLIQGLVNLLNEVIVIIEILVKAVLA